jgi:hypothetical protein
VVDLCPMCHDRPDERAFCPRCGPDPSPGPVPEAGIPASGPVGAGPVPDLPPVVPSPAPMIERVPPGDAPVVDGATAVVPMAVVPLGPLPWAPSPVPAATSPIPPAVPAAPRPPGLEGVPRLIPYLGADPEDGRSLTMAHGIMLAVAIGATAAMACGRLLDSFAVEGGPSARPATGTLYLGLMLLWLVNLALVPMWTRGRRPRAVLEAKGEAHVELPLVWASPPGFGLAAAVLIGVGVPGALLTTNQPVSLEDFHRLDRQQAVALLVIAVGLGFRLAQVVRARRTQRARLAWSAPFRQAPEAVRFVHPLTEHQAARERARFRRPGDRGWGVPRP